MNRRIVNIFVLLFCLAIIFSLTGCQDNDALIGEYTDKLSGTYWTWIDTSPTSEDVTVHCYAHLNEDGSLDMITFTHEDDDIIRKKDNEYEYTWEILVHKGVPCVKNIKYLDNGVKSSEYFLIETENDSNQEIFSYSMYLPGTDKYSEDKTYIMTELTADEYAAAIDSEKKQKINTVMQNSGGSTTNTFANKYGSPTTKCAHSGCSNYIADSGDTNCCTLHSKNCLNCNCFIDEDALYCMNCLSSALSD